MRNPFKKRITWLSLNQFNKVSQFKTYHPRPTKKEVIVYSILGINVMIPLTAWPLTNPLIWKLGRRLDFVR